MIERRDWDGENERVGKKMVVLCNIFGRVVVGFMRSRQIWRIRN